jgi:hypothetical protein
VRRNDLRHAASTARAAAAHTRRQLDAVRSRSTDGNLELQLDCERSDCPVVRIRLHVREQGSRIGGAVRCPACGAQLIARSVLTAAEANAEHEAWARASVNRQLFVAHARQKLGDPAAAVEVPAEVLVDTRLPGLCA